MTAFIRVAALLAAIVVTASPAAIAADSKSAEAVPTAHYLTLALANEAAQAAVAKCTSLGLHSTVTVINEYGVVLVQLHDEHASMQSVYASQAKAWTALSVSKAIGPTSSADIAKRLAPNGTVPTWAMAPQIMLSPGGFVITYGSEMIGAIGAGGTAASETDEGCAKAGLEKIKDRLKP